MDEEARLREDQARARRGLTPDQEELLGLYEQLGALRRQVVDMTARLHGFETAPGQGGTRWRQLSEAEAAPLRAQLAALKDEQTRLLAIIDRLDARIDEQGAF